MDINKYAAPRRRRRPLRNRLTCLLYWYFVNNTQDGSETNWWKLSSPRNGMCSRPFPQIFGQNKFPIRKLSSFFSPLSSFELRIRDTDVANMHFWLGIVCVCVVVDNGWWSRSDLREVNSSLSFRKYFQPAELISQKSSIKWTEPQNHPLSVLKFRKYLIQINLMKSGLNPPFSGVLVLAKCVFAVGKRTS